jgi:hypothetical protein
MSIKADAKMAHVMMFAEDLADEFEGKGYTSRALFLGMVHLMSIRNVEEAGYVLARLDDIVMEAPRCRTSPQRRTSSKQQRRSNTP